MLVDIYSFYSYQQADKKNFKLREFLLFTKDFGFYGEQIPQYRVELIFTKILTTKGARGKFQDFVHLMFHVADFLFARLKMGPEESFNYFINEIIRPKFKKVYTKKVRSDPTLLLKLAAQENLPSKGFMVDDFLISLFVKNDNLLKHVPPNLLWCNDLSDFQPLCQAKRDRPLQDLPHLGAPGESLYAILHCPKHRLS